MPQLQRSYKGDVMKILARFFFFLLRGAMGVAIIGGLVVLMAEWFSGCGESYIDAQGNSHQYECVFINRK